MKTFSKVALAAAMVIGSGSFIVAAPVEAKKKDEAPKGDAPLKLSEPVRTAAVAFQTAYAAKDVATSETNVAAMEAAAKTDDEKYIAQVSRLQVEALKINSGGSEQSLAAPLDALLANPRTPKADIGRFANMRGSLNYNAKQYPQALANFQRARDAGFTDPNLSLQIVRSKVESGDVAGGLADLETSVKADKAAGRPVSEDIYRYAIARLYKTNDLVGAARWTEGWLRDYGTAKNWRDAILIFGFQGPAAKNIDNRQKVDLFRLMRATKSLADQNDYMEYADATYKIGLASETKAILTEGKSNGKIPATFRPAIETIADANKQISSDGSLATQEKAASASKTGKLAADTGDFALGAGDYAKAIEMYTQALQKGSVDGDAVNTHLGIAKAMTGDKAGAKAAFALVTTKPRADIAALWILYVDSPPVA